MNRILFVLGMFIILNSTAQQTAKPFHHANTIMITTDATLDDVIKSLQNHGYVIDNYDRETGIIKTEHFKLWRSSGQTGIIQIWKDKGRIFITGFAYTHMFGSSTSGKMEKRGTGNMFGKCFEKVNEFAIKFANETKGEISYLEL